MESDGPVTSAGTHPEGRVTVTRDGVSTTYDVVSNRARAEDPAGEELGVFAGCGQGNFIQPGDLVEVVLTRTSSTPPATTTTLTAGEGWRC